MTKEELEKEFHKYLKDSSDYYDSREPLTERKLLQMWLDCAELREKQITELTKACDETQKLLDKQIEATYKVVEELNRAKEIIREFGDWANWQGNSKCPSFKKIKDKAEAFLKEE